jgi:hypothetical protein
MIPVFFPCPVNWGVLGRGFSQLLAKHEEEIRRITRNILYIVDPFCPECLYKKYKAME